MTAASSSIVPPEAEQLLRRGEHAAAARMMEHVGAWGRAAGVWEQIFEHAHALVAHERAGDLVAAVRCALALDDNAAVERLVGASIAGGQGDALLSSLLRAGRLVEAARVHLARGDVVRAADAFEEAGALDRAAIAREELGQVREAGLLLERWLEVHPDDAAALLRLGRLLARFGRHDDAITLLQRALRHASSAGRALCEAAPTMILAFSQLGYDHAAHAVLQRWQRARALLADDEGERAPDTVEAVLASARGVAFAAVQGVVDGSDVVAGDARMLLNGRYLLGEPLGGGGVGQVFRAHDAFLDRAVAVKIFGQQALASDAVQAFAREVRAASALQDPGIVGLVELNMAQGFIATELVVTSAPDGRELLEQRLRSGGDAAWVVPTTRALLSTLAACHRTGLVHGGLKPTNVFVVPGGVRVVDVGAHRLLALRSTETGGLASSWPYLSPEMLVGAPADVAGDLYAVGAILYRALTGHTPYPRAQDDRRHAPVAAHVHVAALAGAWSDFLARALHPDLQQRFASAQEMSDALPALSPSALLPSSSPARVEDSQGAVEQEGQRYVRGALVVREGTTRTYEGDDALLGRPVWIVEDEHRSALAPLIACARVWRGVQPIHDVTVDGTRVVLARDVATRVMSWEALRAVPQGLARDLHAVAEALTMLHGHGVALGGFALERAQGPIGPRLRFAPAPLPVVVSDAARAADVRAFEALVCAAFDVPDAVHATLHDAARDAAHVTDDVRARLLATLHDAHVIERRDVESLAQSPMAGPLQGWPMFLAGLTTSLVNGAQARVVARLARVVVKGG